MKLAPRASVTTAARSDCAARSTISVSARVGIAVVRETTVDVTHPGCSLWRREAGVGVSDETEKLRTPSHVPTPRNNR